MKNVGILICLLLLLVACGAPEATTETSASSESVDAIVAKATVSVGTGSEPAPSVVVEEPVLEETIIEDTISEETTSEDLLVESSEPVVAPEPEGPQTVTFVLDAYNFKYVMDGVDEPELRVKKGDTVRIELNSVEGFHDWVVDELRAITKRINQGKSTFIEFEANKVGEFEYYCGVGLHRAKGMVGQIIVEE